MMKIRTLMLMAMLPLIQVSAQQNDNTVKPQAFLEKSQLPNGMRFLAPPPALTSPEYMNDVYYYQWGKEQRDIPEVAQQAAEDETAWTSAAFSPAVGFTIGPDTSPEIFLLCEGARKDANNANFAVKNHYKRRRPFVQFGEPSLVEKYDSVETNTFSFPSGHASRGWIYAFVLATVVPDSTDALMARAQEYAMNRVICGRHYKSDVDASLMMASATLCRLMANEKFQQQLVKARKEYARIRNKRK